MTISIRRLSPQEFSVRAPELVDIYIAAMDYSPRIRANRISVWRREIMRPGFSAVIAEENGQAVGIAYGFLGTPDAWWDQQLRRGLENRGALTDEHWTILRNYYELAEIHVQPGKQGSGIGRQMFPALLATVPARFILLSTPEVDGEANHAFHLYRSLGFTDLLRRYVYPGDNRTFAVLSLDLHAEEPTSGQ